MRMKCESLCYGLSLAFSALGQLATVIDRSYQGRARIAL
jgi:hypothetical protein